MRAAGKVADEEVSGRKPAPKPNPYLPSDLQPKPPAVVDDPVDAVSRTQDPARVPIDEGNIRDLPGAGKSGGSGGPGKSGGGDAGGDDLVNPYHPPGGPGKGGNQSLNPMLPDPTEGLGFGAPNIRPVAGADPFQMWAASNLPGMMGPTEGEWAARRHIGRGIQQGQERVTGAGLPGGPKGTNPAFEATRRAFEEMTIPQIRQSRTMMGLGDSNAVTKDIAGAWAGVLPSLVEAELGREERAIDRGVGSRFAGASGIAGLSGARTAREFGATDRGFGFGTGFRGIAEEGNRAIFEDFLRRQGISERLLFAPFGQAGATIGSTSETGGLFK